MFLSAPHKSARDQGCQISGPQNFAPDLAMAIEVLTHAEVLLPHSSMAAVTQHVCRTDRQTHPAGTQSERNACYREKQRSPLALQVEASTPILAGSQAAITGSPTTAATVRVVPLGLPVQEPEYSLKAPETKCEMWLCN